MKSLKDYIYHNFFWKKDIGKRLNSIPEDVCLSSLFRDLYDEFLSCMNIRQ